MRAASLSPAPTDMAGKNTAKIGGSSEHEVLAAIRNSAYRKCIHCDGRIATPTAERACRRTAGRRSEITTLTSFAYGLGIITCLTLAICCFAVAMGIGR